MARPQSAVVKATRRRRPKADDAATPTYTAGSPSTMAFTVPEAAVHLRVSERTVYRLIKSGELKTFPVGDLTRVSRTSLEAFMERSK